MISLKSIESSLNNHTPEILSVADIHRAAVAAVLCEYDDGVELLFIERARVDGDPWSGHIAFPGGRKEDVDAGARETAERETLEELGLDLGTGRYLGRLDDMAAHIDPIKVSGFVYHIDKTDTFMYSHEVHKAFWFPLQGLIDTTRQKIYQVPGEIPTRLVPSIDLLGPGHTVLWGLTYRFVMQLMEMAGVQLPKHTL